MIRLVIALTASACMIQVCGPAPAYATANHDYKKNEYPILASGSAPNKLLSIASHGGGELGNDHFHLYLMAEPTHKIIARLESIGPDNVLDTAPEAFHAQWSADSRHIAVLFRFDRHFVAMLLYEIRNLRPHLLSGPELLDQVTKKAAVSAKDYRLRSSVVEFSWLSPTRFALKERGLLSFESPDIGRKLGQ
jgi:hypothetical protein